MKGKKLLLALASSLFLIGGTVSLAACGQQGEVAVTSISLDKSELSLLVGGKGTLNATVLPDNATDKTVTWTSSDEKIATVANGEVTAIAAGSATITAKAGSFEAKCEVTVAVVPEVTGISVAIQDLNDEVALLDEKYANAAYISVSVKTVGKADGLKGYKVTSSDDSVLAILESAGNYFAAGLAAGKAKIIATSTFDATKKAELEVEVVAPYVRGLSLNQTGAVLVLESENFHTADILATVKDFGGSDYELEFKSSDTDVVTVAPKLGEDGETVVGATLTAVGAGQATIIFTAGEKSAECNVTVLAAGSHTPANGARSFVYSNATEREQILGALEKYAVENKLTGLTLYGDGGFVMYQDSVVKGTETYIPGFGFGVLSSGSINADLEGESKQEWKRYYHTYETDDPKNLNYMDDKGSVVGNLIGYVAGGYYTTYMNDTKDGYKWVGDLATNDRPVAMNLNESTQMATKWEIPVKTGSALKYRTRSTTYAAFNNREVKLEDYVTPYQIYYTQSYGLARSAENLTGSGSIKGAKAFYEASAKGFTQAAWDKIGIKTATHDGQDWIQFEFNMACTQFYAMYYLSSSMFAPVPAEFITTIGGGDFAEGVATWGRSNADGSLTPLDHWLSTGPYTVEAWDKDQQIVFARNENWEDEDEHYAIQGVHINILAAQKTDQEAAYKEFFAKKLHAAGIPSTKLDDPANAPYRTQTADSSTYKLNLNTCDADTWEQLFGVNGSVTQTPKSDYWEVEPAMNNKNFVSGLSFAINRAELAESEGRTPTANYFGSAYMSDPENGIAYNSTQTHKDAVASIIGEAAGTDEYGYSLAKAKEAFKTAAEELIEDGFYEEGDEIEIEIAWQTQSQIDRTHATLKKYFEDAFNTDDNPLKLKVVPWVGAEWSDVYYNKMMLGQFDIGFGSISGNTLNPLNFLEVLRSDNSSGFTLNWGLDTNAVDPTLSFKDEFYSFDALWQAADQGAYIVNGRNEAIPYEYDEDSVEFGISEDKVTVTLDVLEVSISGGDIKTQFAGLVFFGYPEAISNAGYLEAECDSCVKAEDQSGVADGYVRYVVTFNASTLAPFNTAVNAVAFSYGYVGFDLYFVTTMFGVDSDPTYQTGIDASEYLESLDDLYPGND